MPQTWNNFAWPLAQMGFGAPGLALAGVALAAIPIIIHLLNRRRFKPHKWAAMQYLLEAMRRNRRRLQFENWLLLAMRCCAILLAAVALARPIGCSQAAAGRVGAEAARLHVIVIDNSASMAYQVDQSDARTCLERGKRIAEQILKKVAESRDAVCVIAAAAGELQGPTAPIYDLDAAGRVLGAVEQTYAQSDLPAAIRRAIAVARENGEFTSRRLYLLTDSTRPAWQGRTVEESLRQLGPEAAGLFDVMHVDVGEIAAVNGSVADVRMLASVATTGMPVDFASLPQSSSSANAALIWQSGSRVLGTSATMTLGPDGNEQLLPQVSLPDGPAAISARLEPSDRLPEDDQRSTAFTVRKRLNIVVAESDRGSAVLQSPGTFLQMALAPAEAAEGENSSTVAAVEVVGETELMGKPLAGRDAVILTAPSSMSADDAKQLRKYVEDGGTLLVFMGEGVRTDFCNQVLAEEGLLPGKIAGIISLSEGQEPYRFDFRPDAALHPLLRVFRGEQNSGLGSTRVWTYARVDLDAKLAAERVLNMASGEPAITLHTLGRGKVLFCCTSADTRWTTLPAKPAFVALVHELMLGTIRLDDAWRNLIAGQELAIPRRILEGNPPSLSDANGRVLPLAPGDAPRPDVAYASGGLNVPGLYRLQVDGRQYPVAVGFPREESDLTHLTAAAIRSALGDIELQQFVNEAPMTSSSQDRGDFGWPLLLGALGLLLTESFLAMWFRR